MSKELDELIPDNPLDCLKALRKSANTYCSFNNAQCEYNKALADNIEKALQRLESIDNAKLSEALKWLEKYKSTILFNTTIVENALLKTQEQERVLEIVKEKEVNLGMLKTCKTVEQYNAGCRIFERNELTQEEFDLLKKWSEGE
jgi:hypothetical protein